MADDVLPQTDDSAEKAYAAAAGAMPVKAESEAPAAVATAAPPPVEFPAKARRAARPAPAESAQTESDQPESAKPTLPKARKPAARTKAAGKARKVGKPAKLPAAKTKPVAPKPTKAAAKPRPAGAIKLSIAPQPKEKLMDKSSEFVEGVQKAAAETQAKAKQAFEKGSAMFGDYADFAKGNVEAFVESGKILAAGMQGMGSTMIAEGKSALDTVTSDVKQLAAVKSPGEFLKLQTDILRRNLDSAVKLSTKNGEAMLKLASDSFAPISGRVALAIDKLKKAA